MRNLISDFVYWRRAQGKQALLLGAVAGTVAAVITMILPVSYSFRKSFLAAGAIVTHSVLAYDWIRFRR